MRVAWLYVLLLTAIWSGISWMRPDEDAIPPRTEVPPPTVVVHDLVVPATRRRLGFAAGEARPRSGTGPITLGGMYEGLLLRRVRIDLEPDWWLEADAGSFVDHRLSLEGRVAVRHGDRRLLEAGRVDVVGDEFRFGGVVRIHTDQGTSRDDQLVASRVDLLRRLK